jgi:hypothetical protein
VREDVRARRAAWRRAGVGLVVLAASVALSANAVSRGEGAPDSPLCQGKKATMTGTPGYDVIGGTAGRDVIAVGGGPDQVYGKKGNDLICGGAGPDDLRGGKGADEAVGGDGDDVLVGDRGRDRLRGKRGANRLFGWFGFDRCLGGREPGSEDDHADDCEVFQDAKQGGHDG